jgi:hypothetical protein
MDDKKPRPRRWDRDLALFLAAVVAAFIGYLVLYPDALMRLVCTPDCP